MLKNIIFDFGNVIMNYNPNEILNHYELSPADHDLLRKTIFESKEWSEIDAGKITEKKATEIFTDRVPDKLKSKVKQIMATWPENVDFYEPVFNYMEKLRQDGYKIYGLSKTGMQFANFVKNSEMGNYFDGYVFSAQEKLLKPDRRIYEKLIARYILKPEESLFIDDLKANTNAAKKLGMQAFTFKIDKLGELQDYIASH
ncbi:HAD family hydrolase [Lactobacillus gasseri]|uniref:HAD family hydrolase n=1 Tax=Lactobacillus gasseri TaxID=1596 RepID=UPI0011845E24|nr:HAD family phosphatase [Lactobacillus gasseri]